MGSDWQSGQSPRVQPRDRTVHRSDDRQEADFTDSLGFQIEGTGENLSTLEVDKFAAMIAKATAAYPNFKVIAATIRHRTLGQQR